jgi:2-polyprenyl-6-methoxyphenol hydroxylase-like FAD-dependent oxidoreductase
MPDVDLLVIGAGMAGLTAAARATRAGRRVLVAETAEDVGGSTRYAGYAWTAPSREVIDAVAPGGDISLRHARVDRFADGIAWIRSLGVETRDAVQVRATAPATSSTPITTSTPADAWSRTAGARCAPAPADAAC